MMQGFWSGLRDRAGVALSPRIAAWRVAFLPIVFLPIASLPTATLIAAPAAAQTAAAPVTGAPVTGAPVTGAPAPSPPTAPAPGVPVSVAPATRQDVPVLVRGLGTVQPYASVLVRAKVDGTLDSVNFTEGQEVRAGDVLAQIDPRPYQAALDLALAKKSADQAQLVSAQSDVARYKSLASQQIESRQKFESVTAAAGTLQANIQGDDAAIATARLNLEFTRIVAPIGGRVGLRLTDPGNFIRSAEATGLVAIAQTRPISVVFTLPQDQLPGIVAAMKASGDGKVAVFAASGDDRTQLGQGTLLTPDNAIDPATGTIKLKATFPNADNALWPGQFVNARLLLETRRNALTVPTAAVQHGPSGLYVYVVKPDNTVERRAVTRLQDAGAIAVLAEGAIDDNARVVTAGHTRLQQGARVSIAEPAPAGASTKPAGA